MAEQFQRWFAGTLGILLALTLWSIAIGIIVGIFNILAIFIGIPPIRP